MSGGARIARDESSPFFETGERLTEAGRQYTVSVFAAKAVDPLVSELVHARCAQIHDCRFCKSVRLIDAVELGFDEEMNAKIARYETSDFEPRIVAALRLCDAIIIDPRAADEALFEELHRHFSDEQIAEICLDVMHWGEQKHLVSLRLEEPPSEEINLISFDDEGGFELHGPVPGAVS